MKKFLEELYWLNNEENPLRHSHNRALQKATNTFCKCEVILTKRLKGKNLKTFIKSVNATDEMTAHIAIENFVDGTKIGARLMIEILGGGGIED